MKCLRNIRIKVKLPSGDLSKFHLSFLKMIFKGAFFERIWVDWSFYHLFKNISLSFVLNIHSCSKVRSLANSYNSFDVIFFCNHSAAAFTRNIHNLFDLNGTLCIFLEIPKISSLFIIQTHQLSKKKFKSYL